MWVQLFKDKKYSSYVDIRYQNKKLGKYRNDGVWSFFSRIEAKQLPEETDNEGLALIIRNFNILVNEETKQVKRFSGEVACENYYKYNCRFKVANFHLPGGEKWEDEVD